MSVNNDNGLVFEAEPADKAVEVIKLISQAEDAGKKRREFAEAEARLIIDDASDRAEKSVAFEEAKAEEKIKKIRELTEQKGRELAVSILTQVKDSCEELKESARQNKPEAIVAVVERIVSEWR